MKIQKMHLDMILAKHRNYMGTVSVLNVYCVVYLSDEVTEVQVHVRPRWEDKRYKM